MACTPPLDAGYTSLALRWLRAWLFYFYIDIEGHPDTDNVGHALEELRKACGFFKILGTYPVDVH